MMTFELPLRLCWLVVTAAEFVSATASIKSLVDFRQHRNDTTLSEQVLSNVE